MAASSQGPPTAQLPLPSKALNEAFADYEAQLLKTADKRLKGRHSTIRYNRRRFAFALQRLQAAKVIVQKDDRVDDDDGKDAAATSTKTTTIAEKGKTESSTTTARQDCLRRLSSVAEEASKQRTLLRDAKSADEMLERIRHDPRRRKVDVDVEDIVKQLDDIENHCRGRLKTTTTTSSKS